MQVSGTLGQPTATSTATGGALQDDAAKTEKKKMNLEVRSGGGGETNLSEAIHRTGISRHGSHVRRARHLLTVSTAASPAP